MWLLWLFCIRFLADAMAPWLLQWTMTNSGFTNLGSTSFRSPCSQIAFTVTSVATMYSAAQEGAITGYFLDCQLTGSSAYDEVVSAGWTARSWISCPVRVSILFQFWHSTYAAVGDTHVDCAYEVSHYLFNCSPVGVSRVHWVVLQLRHCVS
jgi:hypothetical protein